MGQGLKCEPVDLTKLRSKLARAGRKDPYDPPRVGSGVTTKVPVSRSWRFMHGRVAAVEERRHPVVTKALALRQA